MLKRLKTTMIYKKIFKISLKLNKKKIYILNNKYIFLIFMENIYFVLNKIKYNITRKNQSLYLIMYYKTT